MFCTTILSSAFFAAECKPLHLVCTSVEMQHRGVLSLRPVKVEFVFGTGHFHITIRPPKLCCWFTALWKTDVWRINECLNGVQDDFCWRSAL